MTIETITTFVASQSALFGGTALHMLVIFRKNAVKKTKTREHVPSIGWIGGLTLIAISLFMGMAGHYVATLYGEWKKVEVSTTTLNAFYFIFAAIGYEGLEWGLSKVEDLYAEAKKIFRR